MLSDLKNAPSEKSIDIRVQVIESSNGAEPFPTAEKLFYPKGLINNNNNNKKQRPFFGCLASTSNSTSLLLFTSIHFLL